MTFINKFLLWLVLLPKGLYQKMGVDTHQLKAIMTIKLMIDDRTPNTFMQLRRGGSAKKTISGTSIWAVITSVFIGLGIMGMSFFYTHKPIGQLSLYFSLYIILFSLFLISDFTSVLIDVRDNYIILPKPVNDKTLVMSRLLYIFIYLFKIALPLLLPAIIYLAVDSGWWPTFVFAILSILVTVFTIFIVNTVYIIIIRVTTPQKFKNIISYLQIAFAVVIYASYQVVPHLLRSSKVLDNISPGNWKWIIPSYWFAGGWDFFSFFTFNASLLVCAALSICVPFAGIWLVIKYLVPSFNKKLFLITSSTAEETAPGKVKTTVKNKSRLSEKTAGLLTRKGAERMAYLFSWKMTGRSRDYRLKVFPFMGYMLVLIFMLGYNTYKKVAIGNVTPDNMEIKVLVMASIYLTSFMLIAAIAQISYSEKFKASWIYHTLPVKAPGELISGAVKSVVVKFFVPFAIIISGMSIYFLGAAAIPNIILGEANQLFLCGIYTLFLVKDLPFSEEQSAAQRTRTLRGLGLMIALAIMGGIHYLIFDLQWAVYILTALSLTGTAFLVKGVREITWEELYKHK